MRTRSIPSKVISSLGLITVLTACGEGGTSSVPPGIPPAPTPKNLIEPNNALSVGAGGPTLISGPSAPVLAAASLDLKALNGTSWVSSCYRFGDKGDYSKKFWSIAESGMSSLLVKYKDEACKDVSPPPKPYEIWKLNSLNLSTHTDDWSIVIGKCASGCTGEINTAMRVKAGELHEGNKNNSTGSYFIEEGRYLVFNKANADLEKIVVSANGGSTPTEPQPTEPTAPVSTEGTTGLALLDTLAGKTYGLCLPRTSNGVTTSSRRTLSFAKGGELAEDSYSSGNATYQSADCTGEARLSTPWVFTNLVVKAAEVEGWIYLESRSCTGSGCKPQKALLQLTTSPEGFRHAGEKSEAGTYYTESPRDYVLAP